MCFLAGCSPRRPYELGNQDIVSADLAEGIAYEVTVNQTDNSVELKSLMPSNYQVCWNHPPGIFSGCRPHLAHPLRRVVQCHCRCADPRWRGLWRALFLHARQHQWCPAHRPIVEKLSGSSGKLKTWVLDVDAQGKTTYFVGPLALLFYGTDDTWEQVTEGKANFSGADSWNWQADWAGNGSWLFSSTGAMDYGSMTFDLIDGAHWPSGRQQCRDHFQKAPTSWTPSVTPCRWPMLLCFTTPVAQTSSPIGATYVFFR